MILEEKKPWDLVGPPQPSDKDFKPVEHRKTLASLAPELVAFLSQGSPKAIGDGYEEIDRQAIDTQGKYKSTLERAVRLSIWAACFAAAAAVYGGMIKDQPWPTLPYDLLIIRSLVFAQIICLFRSALVVRGADENKQFKAWRERRASAEHARVTLFIELMSDASGPKSGKAMQQALSYALRHLFWSQLKYFDDRSDRHETDAGKRVNRRRDLTYFTWFSMGIGVSFAVFSLFAIFVEEGSNNPLVFFKADYGVEALLGGLGVIAAALLAAGQSGELIHRDEENSRRYRETIKRLQEHGGSWDAPSKSFLDAFEAAGQGHPNLARKWTEDLVAILAAEHVQWMSTKPSDLRLGPVDDLVARP